MADTLTFLLSAIGRDLDSEALCISAGESWLADGQPRRRETRDMSSTMNSCEDVAARGNYIYGLRCPAWKSASASLHIHLRTTSRSPLTVLVIPSLRCDHLLFSLWSAEPPHLLPSILKQPSARLLRKALRLPTNRLRLVPSARLTCRFRSKQLP